MTQKQRTNSLINNFVDKYSLLAELEEEKLQLQSEVMAVYVELSLSKFLFIRNSELKIFHDALFHEILTGPLPDYLYKSRTQVIARGIRELYGLDLYSLKTLQERIELFLESQKIDPFDNNNSTNSNELNFIEYWTNIISSKGK